MKDKHWEEQSFIRADTFSRYAGDRRYCVVPWHSREVVFVTADQMELLKICSRPRIAEDVYRIAEERGWYIGKCGELEAELKRLLEMGVLREFGSLLENSRKQKTSVAPDESDESQKQAEAPRIISWITEGRLETLLQSIYSFVGNLQHFGRTTELNVIGPCTTSSVTVDVQTELYRLKEETGLRMIYTSGEETSTFIQAVKKRAAAAGVVPEIVDFAVDSDHPHASTGAQRNLALLAAAGNSCVLHEEDLMCETVPTHVSQRLRELRLSSSLNHYISTSYAEVEDLFHTIKSEPHDYLSLHNRLGTSLASYVTSGFQTYDYANANSEMARLLEQERGWVAVSAMGVYGETPDYDHTVFRCIGDEHARQWLFARENDYDIHRSSRDIALSIEKDTIATRASALGAAIGLDNREPLAPFFPLFKGSRYVFSHTVRCCQPEAVIAFHPWMVKRIASHVTPPTPNEKGHEHPMVRDYLVFLCEDYGSQNTRMQPILKTTTRSYSVKFGRFVRGIGELSRESFTEYLLHIWRTLLSRHMFYVERLLEYYDYTPKYWAEEMQETCKNVEKLLTEVMLPVPQELVHIDPPEEGMLVFQDMVKNYGALIESWPEIWKAASELKREGMPFGREI